MLEFSEILKNKHLKITNKDSVSSTLNNNELLFCLIENKLPSYFDSSWAFKIKSFSFMGMGILLGVAHPDIIKS